MQKLLKKEPVRWSVIYQDGTKLEQFENNGEYHTTNEINWEEVLFFEVYNERDKKKYRIKEEKVKFQYINYILNALTPQEKRIRIYCFGYDKNWTFILPNDTIIRSEKEDLIFNLEEYEK